jgi:hypothetical protein
MCRRECDDRQRERGSDDSELGSAVGDGGVAGGDYGAGLRSAAGAQARPVGLVALVDVVRRLDLRLGMLGQSDVIECACHVVSPLDGCQPGPVRTGAIVPQ